MRAEEPERLAGSSERKAQSKRVTLQRCLLSVSNTAYHVSCVFGRPDVVLLLPSSVYETSVKAPLSELVVSIGMRWDGEHRIAFLPFPVTHQLTTSAFQLPLHPGFPADV